MFDDKFSLPHFGYARHAKLCGNVDCIKMTRKLNGWQSFLRAAVGEKLDDPEIYFLEDVA